ncbi:sulfotransferase family protein [Winogradskyella sp. A3E31]|uniref:sulfotransferase family protein n=1 Tax=Winogradskyella sp. A3E31 TaxID=3349637 RepID=UPI00398B1E46
MTEANESFFILSNPRSGSTLLRIILQSHPNITVPPECGFLQWWHLKYKNWSQLDAVNRLEVEKFCKDLASSKKIETYNLDFNLLKENINEQLPENYSDLMALVYKTYGVQQHKDVKVWGDKNNYYIKHIDLIKQLYPHTKYIHLVRDGRDVAVSYFKLKKIKTESPYKPVLHSKIDDIAREWDYNNQNILNSLSTIKNENKLTVLYEDLVSNLEQECIRLSKFLGVEFNAKMLDYYIINNEKELEPKLTLDWKMKTLMPPDINLIGQYKMYFSDKEINSFNAIANKSLLSFNYV